jgi:predicted acylesterase/phospholipase RssA
LEVGLEKLLDRSAELSPLLAPVFQTCFQKRTLPASLREDSQSLYQQWRQSQGVLRNALDSEAEEKVQAARNNTPDQEIADPIAMYYAQAPVFAAFLSHHLKQQAWLMPTQENLGLLEVIAQTVKVNVCIWSSAQRGNLSLIHSFEQAQAKKTCHLLQQANRPFKHLVPQAVPERDEGKADLGDGAGPEVYGEEEVKESETLVREDRPTPVLLAEADEPFLADLGVFRNRQDQDYFHTGLSIDGGGIRGFIPALALQKLEDASGKRIYELFDLVGGTSIGGILSLGCVATVDHRTPLWSIDGLVKLFREEGETIFPSSNAKLRKAKYSPKPLEGLLNRYFGECNLSDSLTSVLVTGVEIKIPKGPTLYTFESAKAQRNEYHDYLMRHVARATTAAPTYFPEATFSSIAQGPARTFVGGGMLVNNPTDLIYKRLVKAVKATPENTWIVSLGTGTSLLQHPLRKKMGLVKAIRPLIETMMEGNSNMVHAEMQGLFAEGRSYWRFQPPLEEEIDLADSSPQALDALENAAHRLDNQIAEVARLLAENADRKHPQSF